MFAPNVPEVLSCGCTLTLRVSDTKELMFLTPCTEAHRETALRLRGRTSSTMSSIVVKAVPR